MLEKGNDEINDFFTLFRVNFTDCCQFITSE